MCVCVCVSVCVVCLCVHVCACVCEERQTKADRQRKKQADRQADRQTNTETETGKKTGSVSFIADDVIRRFALLMAVMPKPMNKLMNVSVVNMKLRVANRKYTEAMADSKSKAFRDFQDEFCSQVCANIS